MWGWGGKFVAHTAPKIRHFVKTHHLNTEMISLFFYYRCISSQPVALFFYYFLSPIFFSLPVSFDSNILHTVL